MLVPAPSTSPRASPSAAFETETLERADEIEVEFANDVAIEEVSLLTDPFARKLDDSPKEKLLAIVAASFPIAGVAF